MDGDAVFVLLKKFKPKMRVNGRSQVRKGQHCPLTVIGHELGVGCEDAEDYDLVTEALCLDADWVENFVYAADYSLAEMKDEGIDHSVLRKQIFKALSLPKSAL